MKNKWNLVWSESSLKDLKKLDKSIAKVIVLKTTEMIENAQIITEVMKPLKYSKSGQYRIRIGSYRVICRVINNECTVEAVSVGHRKNIYNRK